MAEPVETMILGLRVTTTPLPFKQSQPLVPTIAELLAIASKDLAPLVTSGKLNPKANVLDPEVILAVLPMLGSLASYLENRLDKLAAKLLATTRVAVESASGDLEWYDLVKPGDWEYVFDKHPELYIPLTLHAGRVTFGRFFPARGQPETGAPASISPIFKRST